MLFFPRLLLVVGSTRQAGAETCEEALEAARLPATRRVYPGMSGVNVVPNLISRMAKTIEVRRWWVEATFFRRCCLPIKSHPQSSDFRN